MKKPRVVRGFFNLCIVFQALGLTAFATFAIMLTLLIFIFEAVRDAFDPRKTLGERG